MWLWIWVQFWVADAVVYSAMAHIPLLAGVGRLLWSPDAAGGCGVLDDEAVIPVPSSLGGTPPSVGRGGVARISHHVHHRLPLGR